MFAWRNIKGNIAIRSQYYITLMWLTFSVMNHKSYQKRLKTYISKLNEKKASKPSFKREIIRSLLAKPPTHEQRRIKDQCWPPKIFGIQLKLCFAKIFDITLSISLDITLHPPYFNLFLFLRFSSINSRWYCHFNRHFTTWLWLSTLHIEWIIE